MPCLAQEMVIPIYAFAGNRVNIYSSAGLGQLSVVGTIEAGSKEVESYFRAVCCGPLAYGMNIFCSSEDYYQFRFGASGAPRWSSLDYDEPVRWGEGILGGCWWMKRGRALVVDGVPLEDDSPFSKVDTKPTDAVQSEAPELTPEMLTQPKSKKKSKSRTQVEVIVYMCVLYVRVVCYLSRVLLLCSPLGLAAALLVWYPFVAY